NSAGGYVSQGGSPGLLHSLTGRPNLFRVYAMVNDAGGSAGYSQFDIVPVEAFFCESYTGCPFVTWANDSRIGLARVSSRSYIYIPHKTTGADVLLTSGTVAGFEMSKWSLLFE
ncbi:MAG: hypothetical protein ACKO96_32310, partial [Flammeovirgaceae bacterium]